MFNQQQRQIRNNQIDQKVFAFAKNGHTKHRKDVGFRK
jgi:hypothetical protein